MNKMKQKNKKLFAMSYEPSAMSQRGFTLIELAMVLVVIGLLIALGASLIGPLTKRAKLIESREAVSQAKEAVFGWTVKNTYLPPDIVTAGGKNVDGFGKDLFYIKAAEIDASGKNACRRIAADPNNKTTLNICRNGDCVAGLVRNIAFVIVSGAENYNIQTAAGTPTGCPSGETCVRIYEIGTPNIDDYTTDINRPEDYDDIVQYVSLDEIRTAMGCPQPLQMVSPTTITQGEEDSFYSYSMQAIGGVPPYQWSGTITAGTSCDATPGLNLDASGLISGTISCKDTAPNSGELTACSATINVSAQVTDNAGSNPVSYTGTIPVRPKPLKIITDTLPSGTEGSSYNATLYASGGNVSAYNWTVDSGNLPSGLTLSTVGVISGTIASDSGCSQPSPYNFTVRLNDGCGQPTYKGFSITVNDPDCAGGGGTTTTTTTTTSTTTTTTLPPSPTCTLLASPGIIRYGETTQLTWTITNGPANGTFSPTSGTCTSFSGSTGGSCTTGALTTAGANTFTLTLSPGGNTCQVIVYVGCQDYRVWNDYGSRRDFRIDGTCKRVNNNSEITNPQYLNTGEIIQRYGTQDRSCGGAVQATLSYDQAMNADVGINGGDGDCQVNFSGTDR
jgi:prepilin-type N-terminal cleavage/methylation domain-containing protein